MKKWVLPFLLIAPAGYAGAQLTKDTTVPGALQEVIIKSWQRRNVVHGDESAPFAMPGKKTETINLAGTNANIAVKTGQQVFAKIPGVFVYDMDGSGNQVNIATVASTRTAVGSSTSGKMALSSTPIGTATLPVTTAPDGAPGKD